jgi:hypothetical protein
MGFEFPTYRFSKRPKPASGRQCLDIVHGWGEIAFELTACKSTAAPGREDFLVPSLQEDIKLVIMLVDNRGFARIGGLS